MAKGTKIYGCSDDLIEFDGDVRGEVSCYGTDDQEHGVLLIFSDGTILEAKYGKMDMGVWELKTHKKGSLYDRTDSCEIDSDDDYSDVVHFKPGLTWAYAAKTWQKVR